MAGLILLLLLSWVPDSKILVRNSIGWSKDVKMGSKPISRQINIPFPNVVVISFGRCQKFLSINMMFRFVKVIWLSNANIVADSSPPNTTCIRWNFNNRFTFRNIIFGTMYFVIPPLNISYWLWKINPIKPL